MNGQSQLLLNIRESTWMASLLVLLMIRRGSLRAALVHAVDMPAAGAAGQGSGNPAG